MILAPNHKWTNRILTQIIVDIQATPSAVFTANLGYFLSI